MSMAVLRTVEEATATLSTFAADVDALDDRGVAEVVDLLRRLRHATDVMLAVAARRAERLRSEGQGPGADVLCGGGVSSRTANREVDRAMLLAESPALDEAFASAALGAEHVDAVVSTCSRLAADERGALLASATQLVDDAADVGPDVFSRRLRRRVEAMRTEQDAEARFDRQRQATRLRKGVDAGSGMYWLNAEFDPVTGAGVFDAIDRAAAAGPHPDGRGHTDDLGRQHLAAHALAGLVTAAPDGRGRPAAEVVVLLDHRTLVEGLHDASVCETSHGSSLPPTEVRRLACGANIVPAVLGGDGATLDVGRGRRLATRAQRRALRAAHDTCAVDDCAVGFDDCEIHHRVPWERGGSTDLHNLVPLCVAHHHRAHGETVGRRRPSRRRGEQRGAATASGSQPP